MSITYPAQYKDEFGAELTTIIDDGRFIRLNLRGVEFSGEYFSLTPVPETSSVPSQSFQFFEDELCAYSLDFKLPIAIINDGKELKTELHVQIECGKPVESTGWVVHKRRKDGKIEKETERIDGYAISLEIEIEEKIYKASNPHRGFERSLIELSKQFPPEVYLKICLNCQLSEYPPNIVNSGLRCFRNAKSELRELMRVKDKWAFIELWTEKGIDVDETYVCPEFEKRPPFVWR